MTATQPLSLWEIRFLKCLLILASGCFIGGISLPIMTVTKFIFIENSFSILSGLSDLYAQQRYLLLALITGLSLFLPALKLAILGWVLCRNNGLSSGMHRAISLIHTFGRWAMLDVFVVAILLVSVKLGALAQVEIHSGLYWFACCVLVTMWISHRSQRLIQH